MAIPRRSCRRTAAPAWFVVVLISSIPVASFAGAREGRRAPADLLRKGPGLTNHPVGVVPSSTISIPAGWPLDADGSITCLTCHTKLPAMDGRSNRPYLRDEGDAPTAQGEFCTRCHGGTVPNRAPSMHWLAVRVAHVMPDRGASARPGGRLDGDSRRCLACHDGVNASEAAYSTRWDPGSRQIGDRRRNHPIGVNYPDLKPGKTGAQFRPSSLLPSAIRLPGGSVGCVSCHDLYATNRYRLTVPVEGSRLCFACHAI